jgi:hypothetical protein
MIEAAIDHARRRVTVLPTGEVTGEAYTAWLLELLETQPVLGGYDFIYDLHAYLGRVTHDDIAAMAPRYAALVGQADRGATTILVTTDQGFRFWAELFAVQFPNRRWHVVPDLAAASGLLDSRAACQGLSPADRARSC